MHFYLKINIVALQWRPFLPFIFNRPKESFLFGSSPWNIFSMKKLSQTISKWWKSFICFKEAQPCDAIHSTLSLFAERTLNYINTFFESSIKWSLFTLNKDVVVNVGMISAAAALSAKQQIVRAQRSPCKITSGCLHCCCFFGIKWNGKQTGSTMYFSKCGTAPLKTSISCCTFCWISAV